MIEPRTTDVVVHTVHVDGGQAQVLTTQRGNVAFVYGDDSLAEATLVIRARCPLNDDVLEVGACGCGADKQRLLDVARRAPLGIFIYLRAATIEDFADVLVLLDQLPGLRRLFLPDPAAGDVALLRDATDLRIEHQPVLRPPRDASWPLRPVPNRARRDLTALWARLRG